MRLLLTQTAYPPSIGGAQLHTHQLACHLAQRHQVQVVTQWDTQRTDWLLGTTLTAPRQTHTYQVDGVMVQRISLSTQTRRRLAPWVLSYYVAQGLALKHIAEALAAEISPWATSADLIHNCRIGREGLSFASFKLARAKAVPFVFTPVHHPRWGGWLHRHYHQLYRKADAVIALTDAERRALVELGVDERRVFVTGIGPILAETHCGPGFRARYGLGEDPLVLFVGQKHPYKGVAALLGAAPIIWRRLPETRFVFLGPRTSYSRRIFAGRRDPRLLELDAVSLQEKTDALAACNLLCLPSTQESFGGVFTEAWSQGRPVVGADIPAVRAVIDEGQDGFLTAPLPDSIAERLIYLLERPGLQAQMGARGRDKVAARYTWPRLVEQTEQVYAQVLKSGF